LLDASSSLVQEGAGGTVSTVVVRLDLRHANYILW